MGFIAELTKQPGLFLPEQVQEFIGEPAWQLEYMKRQLLDYYRQQNYQLVLPGFIEYSESFLANSVVDLDLQTFRLTDTYTGKILAVRSDFTAQMIRIDAQLQLSQPQSSANQEHRLCYAGELLHTNTAKGFRCRNPIQAGLELFGNPSILADLEVVSHLLESLNILGLTTIHLDIGHVGLLKYLFNDIDIASEQKACLYNLIQAKNLTEIDILLQDTNLPADLRQIILKLVGCYGDINVLKEAKTILGRYANQQVRNVLDELEDFTDRLQQLLAKAFHSLPVKLYVDLTELQGFSYHTGIIFSALLSGVAKPLAIGGRYTGFNPKCTETRSATGFNINLTHVMQLKARKGKY